MHTRKIAPATPKGQARPLLAAQGIPLSDVTITCSRQSHFVGAEGAQAVTIPGRQLEQILAWLLQTRPSVVGNAADDLWTLTEVGLALEGLGEVIRGLSSAPLEDKLIDMRSVLSFLGDSACDLAARLQAPEDGPVDIKSATIAWPTRPAVA